MQYIELEACLSALWWGNLSICRPITAACGGPGGGLGSMAGCWLLVDLVQDYLAEEEGCIESSWLSSLLS